MPEIEFYKTKEECYTKCINKIKPSRFIVDKNTNRYWEVEWYVNYIK